MSKTQLTQQLATTLADTYALYLKTQNYHWHVKGPNFKSLHELFEEQYNGLAAAVDEIAERILMLGGRAPATFTEFNELKSISDGDSAATANQMVVGLHADHVTMATNLKKVLETAQQLDDEGTVALLSERISAHEKISWMLGASQE